MREPKVKEASTLPRRTLRDVSNDQLRAQDLAPERDIPEGRSSLKRTVRHTKSVQDFTTRSLTTPARAVRHWPSSQNLSASEGRSTTHHLSPIIEHGDLSSLKPKSPPIPDLRVRLEGRQLSSDDYVEDAGNLYSQSYNHLETPPAKALPILNDRKTERLGAPAPQAKSPSTANHQKVDRINTLQSQKKSLSTPGSQKTERPHGPHSGASTSASMLTTTYQTGLSPCSTYIRRRDTYRMQHHAKVITIHELTTGLSCPADFFFPISHLYSDAESWQQQQESWDYQGYLPPLIQHIDFSTAWKGISGLDAKELFRIHIAFKTALEELLASQLWDAHEMLHQQCFSGQNSHTATDQSIYTLCRRQLIDKMIQRLYKYSSAERIAKSRSGPFRMYLEATDCFKKIVTADSPQDLSIALRLVCDETPSKSKLWAQTAWIQTSIQFVDLKKFPREGSLLSIIPRYQDSSIFPPSPYPANVQYSIETPSLSWLTWDHNLGGFTGTVPISCFSRGTCGLSEKNDPGYHEGPHAIVNNLEVVVKAVFANTTPQPGMHPMRFERTIRVRLTFRILPWYSPRHRSTSPAVAISENSRPKSNYIPNSCPSIMTGRDRISYGPFSTVQQGLKDVDSNRVADRHKQLATPHADLAKKYAEIGRRVLENASWEYLDPKTIVPEVPDLKPYNFAYMHTGIGKQELTCASWESMLPNLNHLHVPDVQVCIANQERSPLYSEIDRHHRHRVSESSASSGYFNIVEQVDPPSSLDGNGGATFQDGNHGDGSESVRNSGIMNRPSPTGQMTDYHPVSHGVDSLHPNLFTGTFASGSEYSGLSQRALLPEHTQRECANPLKPAANEGELPSPLESQSQKRRFVSHSNTESPLQRLKAKEMDSHTLFYESPRSPENCCTEQKYPPGTPFSFENRSQCKDRLNHWTQICISEAGCHSNYGSPSPEAETSTSTPSASGREFINESDPDLSPASLAEQDLLRSLLLNPATAAEGNAGAKGKERLNQDEMKAIDEAINRSLHESIDMSENYFIYDSAEQSGDERLTAEDDLLKSEYEDEEMSDRESGAADATETVSEWI